MHPFEPGETAHCLVSGTHTPARSPERCSIATALTLSSMLRRRARFGGIGKGRRYRVPCQCLSTVRLQAERRPLSVDRGAGKATFRSRRKDQPVPGIGRRRTQPLLDPGSNLIVVDGSSAAERVSSSCHFSEGYSEGTADALLGLAYFAWQFGDRLDHNLSPSCSW